MTIPRKGHLIRSFSWFKDFSKSLLNLLVYCFCFMFFGFPGHEEYGILPPQPGTEPACPALEAEILTTGLPGQSQDS